NSPKSARKKQMHWLGRKAADYLKEPSTSVWTLPLRPRSVEIRWLPYLKRQALREWKCESGMWAWKALICTSLVCGPGLPWAGTTSLRQRYVNGTPGAG